MARKADHAAIETDVKNDGLYLLQSVDNALSIVDTLCEEDGLSLAEIASRLGFGKSSAFRLLYTLQRHGMVDKDQNARYHLGFRLLSMGRIVSDRDGMVSAIHPYLEDISQVTGETSHLVAWNNDTDVIFIDKVLGEATFHMDSMVGVTRAAHLTATGKSLLAWSSDAFVERYLAKAEFEAFTPHSIMSGGQLLDELRKTRARGYSCDAEESEIGLTCYAVPIVKSGVTVCAISVSGPTERMTRNRDAIVKALKGASEKIAGA